MSNNINKSLRDKYMSNTIFRIGDIVEDKNSGTMVKILDRGTNYVTVETESGTAKRWLEDLATPLMETTVASDFEITEGGQIKLFGHETKNFDEDLSEFMIEQFLEFDDLYSKHQIVKCLDYAIQESDSDTAYSLVEKVSGFYEKQGISAPFIVEAMKVDLERRRLVEIITTLAGIAPQKSNYKSVTDSIKALRKKYIERKQWEVLWPFFKLAQQAGLSGILQMLPFQFDDAIKEDMSLEESVLFDTVEDYPEVAADELELDDILMTFSPEEFEDEEQVSEGLSIETRNKLSRKLKQRESILATHKQRAMNRAASSDVILSRARRLAETMLKRRMFHKAPGDMSRQEKERFESGAIKRRVAVARLAQKLVPQVRALQSTRLHHTPTDTKTSHPVETGAS